MNIVEEAKCIYNYAPTYVKHRQAAGSWNALHELSFEHVIARCQPILEISSERELFSGTHNHLCAALKVYTKMVADSEVMKDHESDRLLYENFLINFRKAQSDYLDREMAIYE